jgi:periplasmic divalent cation tolerance protein
MSRTEDEGRALVVMTTAADDEAARTLARTLVEEGLAACVTRLPVRSVYRWEAAREGETPKPAREMAVCEDAEVLLLVKTAAGLRERVERRVKELHSYECPELVAIEPAHVEAGYLAWLLACTS